MEAERFPCSSIDEGTFTEKWTFVRSERWEPGESTAQVVRQSRNRVPTFAAQEEHAGGDVAEVW